MEHRQRTDKSLQSGDYIYREREERVRETIGFTHLSSYTGEVVGEVELSESLKRQTIKLQLDEGAWLTLLGEFVP